MDGVLAGGRGDREMNSRVRLLKGALASKKGKGMSFEKIRRAAAAAARSKTLAKVTTAWSGLIEFTLLARPIWERGAKKVLPLI